jgi:hypothetical protein
MYFGGKAELRLKSGCAFNGLGHLAGKGSPGIKAHAPDCAVPMPLTWNGADYAYGLQRLWRTGAGTAHARRTVRPLRRQPFGVR